ncbi:MAG: PAS domain S-box protein [Candidatus Hydrogenedentes bacterium]|nr:PAS domain S-box protein [Candidatus Hydrogenedentota bacterium]
MSELYSSQSSLTPDIAEEVGGLSLSSVMPMLLLLAGTCAVGFWGAHIRVQERDAEMRAALLEQATTLAGNINPHLAAQLTFTEDDADSPAYRRVRQVMTAFGRNIPNRGIYSMAQREGKLYFGPENYPPEDPMASPPGTEYLEPAPADFAVYITGTPFVVGPTTDEYGTFVTAEAPVMDPISNQVLMVVAIDILAEDWDKSVNSARLAPFLLTVGLLLSFVAGFVLLQRNGRRGGGGRSGVDLRRWVSVPLGVLFFCGLAVLTAHQASEYRKTRLTEGRWVAQTTLLDWNHTVATEAQVLDVWAHRVRENAEVMDAWRAGDRERLLAVAGPIFTHMRQTQSMAILHFVGPDKTNFLRAHLPGVHGDPLSWASLEAAAETGIPQWGLDLGRWGNFSVRYCMPVLDQDALLGYLVVGKDIGAILPRFSRNLRGNIAAVVPKRLVSREAYETGRQMFQYPGNWEDLSQYILVSQTAASLPGGVRDWLEKPHSSFEASSVTMFWEEGRRFLLLPIHLADGQGENMASLVFFQDVTDRYWATINSLVLQGGLALVLFFAAVALIHSITRRAERLIAAAFARMRAREKDLELTLYSIGDAVITTDREGAVARMNPVAENLTGWTAEEAAGFPLERAFRIVNAETRQPEPSPARRVMETRAVVGLENHTILIARGGLERQIADSAAPITDAGGRLRGVIIVFRDVTEQYRVRRELEESRARLAALMDAAGDAILMMNPSGKITFWNPAAVRMFGYTREEALGGDLHKLIAPDRYHAAHKAAFPHFLQTGRGNAVGKTLELEARRKDGSEFPVSLALSAVRMQDGWHGVGIVRDITESRRMAVELRESLRRLQRILDAEDVGVVIADWETHQVRFANKKALDLAGVSEGDMTALRCWDLFSAAEEGKCPIKDLGLPGETKDCDLLTADGGRIPIHKTVAPIMFHGTKCLIETFTDITELRRAQETLAASEAQLRLILDSANVGVIIVDRKTHLIEFANLTALSLFGGPEEEVCGKLCHEFVCPAQRGQCPITDLGMEIESAERVLLTKDGSRVPILKTVSSIPFGGKECLLESFVDISRLKAAEAAVRENEERFMEVLYASDDPVLLIADGAFVDCNDSAARLFGRVSRGELLQTYPADLSPPVQPDGQSSKEKSNAMITAALKQGFHRFEWVHLRKDGGEVFVEVSLLRIVHQGRTMLHAVCRDITEQKRAEEELERNRERLVVATKGMGTGIWEHFLEDNSLYWDEQMLVVYDVAPEELTRHISDWARRVAPEARETVEQELERQIAQGNGIYLEYPIVDRGGGIRHIAAKGIIFTDGTGRPIRTMGVCYDITARKNAEQALRKSEQRMNELAEQGRTVVWEVDAEGMFTYVSPVSVLVYGYQPGEIAGRMHFEALHPEEGRAEFAELIRDIFRCKEPMQGIENLILKKDGSVIWVSTSGIPVLDGDGNLTGYQGSDTDITERRQAHESLERVNRDLAAAIARANALAREAQAASLAKSLFLANMSHEIRTPMNGVIGMTGVLLDTELNAEQRRYAEVIHRSGEALLALINDILDFSKIEAEKLELEAIDFDLRAAVEDVAELLGLRAQEKGLEFICRIAPGTPTLLRGDPGRIRQILNNLGGNAVKFTDTGEVSLTFSGVELPDGTVRLRAEVRDTGIGIPEEKAGSIFNVFEQADASTTRRFGGTGLGLAISRRLVELMGGEIGVESAPGTGSLFWFTVMLGRQAGDAASALTSAEVRGTHVLVLDDNRTNRIVLSEQLEAWGVRHEEVADAQTALDRLRGAASSGDPFSLVITDMQMPAMNGEQFGEAVKAVPELRETRLIMMTSIGQRGDARRLRKSGFSAYLTKPVKQSDLYDCLASVLGTPGGGENAPLITRHRLSEARRGRARILAAEDNPVNQLVIQRVLEKLGFHADVVSNGREAVDALAGEPYDLVLMDLQMPELDGLEATRIIRSGESGVPNPGLPIIAMTAHALKGDRDRCLGAGMDDYVTKPIDPALLLEVLEKWLSPEPAVGLSPPPAPAAPAAPAAETVPAQAPGESPDLPAFVRERLLDMLSGDGDAVREVLGQYLESAPEQLARIADCMARGDAAQAGREAHTLKGASANVGAEALAEAARALEAAGRDGDLDAVARLLPAAEQEFSRLKALLQEDGA